MGDHSKGALMREAGTPFDLDVSHIRSVTDILVERARIAPEHVAFEVADDEGWRLVTTRAFADEVRAVAKGLLLAGVRAGDTVAVMAPTSYAWAVVDFAVLAAGAVVVPLYPSSAPGQVAAILDDAGVRFALGGGAQAMDLLHEGFARADVDAKRVWELGAGLDELASMAEDVEDELYERRRDARRPDDLATIVYTSGTTSSPKGVLIRHRDLIGKVAAVAAAHGDVVHDGGNTVIFLPLSHVLARGLQLACLAHGMRIAHIADPKRAVVALAELQPTFLVVVPRVLEKVLAQVGLKAREKRMGGIWGAARRTAEAWGRHLEDVQEGRRRAPRPWLAAKRALFDKLFYARVRALLGGRLDFLLSGAAPLAASVNHTFRGMGIPVIEGYGLTETTAPLTSTRSGELVAGSVGTPLPGVTVRIADDGEVLAKGVGVVDGYQSESATAEAFVDGWFRTGDLGRLDDDGRLWLEGRTTELIVTSGGKSVLPTEWAQLLERRQRVAHAVVVGDGKPYLTALLVLDPEATVAWAEREGVTDLPSLDVTDGEVRRIDHPGLEAALQPHVEAANAEVSQPERVQKVAVVVADLRESGPFVTPTMKLRRDDLLQAAAAEVDRLYAG